MPACEGLEEGLAIGRVVRSYVEEDLLIEDKLDLRKTDPLVWAIGGDNNYYRVGARLDDN